jgi:hypothetical protein
MVRIYVRYVDYTVYPCSEHEAGSDGGYNGSGMRDEF